MRVERSVTLLVPMERYVDGEAHDASAALPMEEPTRLGILDKRGMPDGEPGAPSS